MNTVYEYFNRYSITEEQVREISSIMVSHFTANNEEELTNLIAEQANKHNLTGLAKKKFEIHLLFFTIAKSAQMN